MGVQNPDSLLKSAVITWLTASKKKNFETTNVFTSITELAEMMATRLIMFITRIVLRMIYPGPARERLMKDIRTGEFEESDEDNYKAMVGWFGRLMQDCTAVTVNECRMM